MDAQHRQALEELHKELQVTQPANEAVREQVVHLQGEINRVLNTPDETTSTDEHLHSLRERLAESIDRIAAHHPALAEAVRIAVNTLANAGT